MKTLRNIGIAAVIVAGVLTLALGYYGFVPGLSTLLGSSKPRDLKVKSTQRDLENAKAKTGVAFGELPKGLPAAASIEFSGMKDVVADLSDQELTALLRSDDWKYDLIDKGEVRINADGTEEISGLLRLDRIYGYAQARRLDTDAIRPYLRALEAFTHHPAFYVKLRAAWNDGRLSLDVQKAEIGRYEFEPKVIKAHAAQLTAAVERHFEDVPGLSIRSVDFAGGKMHFEGTCPASVRWSP